MPPPLALPSLVVFYDGDCGFCGRTVRVLLAIDRRGVLRFAPLQGDTAATVRRAHPEIPADVDSLLVLDHGPEGERVAWRSEGAVRILARLGGFWALLGWLLRLVPRALRDGGYDVVARHRQHMGRRDAACPVPPAAVRARFLP